MVRFGMLEPDIRYPIRDTKLHISNIGFQYPKPNPLAIWSRFPIPTFLLCF
jgi:hypothetical protein